MSSSRLEEMKALLTAHYDAALNEQDLELLDEQLTPDFLDHGMPPGTPQGPGPVKKWLAGLKGAFPDMTIRSDEMVAERDVIAVRSTWTGTHQGEFFGVPGSGRRITFSGAVFWRFQGDRLAERWPFINRDEILRRLTEPTDGVSRPGR